MKKNMQSFYPFLALERKKCSRALRNPLRTIFLAPCVAMVACMACNSAGRYGINAQPEEKLPAGRTETVENEEAIRNKNLETVQKLLGKQSNVTEEGHDGCVPTSRHEWAIQPRRRIHEAVAKGGGRGIENAARQ